MNSPAVKSTDLPRMLDAESVDWSEIVFMIERKISGSELSRYAQVTTQAVGAWRRGIQGPCLYTGISLIFLIAELYIEKSMDEFDSPAEYFRKIGEILPRKGHVPWYPTNNHRKFTPAFRKPPKRLGTGAAVPLDMATIAGSGAGAGANGSDSTAHPANANGPTGTHADGAAATRNGTHPDGTSTSTHTDGTATETARAEVQAEIQLDFFAE